MWENMVLGAIQAEGTSFVAVIPGFARLREAPAERGRTETFIMINHRVLVSLGQCAFQETGRCAKGLLLEGQ